MTSASASYESNFPMVVSDGNPQNRVGNTRTIAGTNMFIGAASVVYHLWTFVEIVRNPELIERSGQPKEVVYMGIFCMVIIGLILVPVSWIYLFKGVGMLSSSPPVALKKCQCWRRWMGCFLTFFIVSLMILVLGSEQHVHQGEVQNYMAALLILSSFVIFCLYYVGKQVDEIKEFYCSQTSANTTDINNVVCPSVNDESSNPPQQNNIALSYLSYLNHQQMQPTHMHGDGASIL